MRRLLLALAGPALLLTACGAQDADDASADVGGGGGATGGAIVVFAAASLTESFTELAERFEAANPGTTVTLSFGPSSGLATQITQGAPADVFASASATTMDDVVATGAASRPTTFATNTGQIAVPPDNPAGVTDLADLARPDVTVALCAPDVPCGKLAADVFANANLSVTPVTLEADVKATLTKVELGEVDAAVVYVTDVLAAGDAVQGIGIPADVNASTSYPIATLTGSADPRLAQAFVDYVLSDDGGAVLAAAGFTAP